MVSHVMNEWKHIFKLDPAKEISDEKIEQICTSGTDAIIVGGTDHVTLDGVLHLLSKIKQYKVTSILEVSTIDAITPGFDYYFIPMVLNSTDKKWVMDVQHEAIKQFKSFMDWDTIFMEGYCILNEHSKAFIKSKSKLPDDEDVLAYAHMAEHMFKLPIFYVEYSGIYGNPRLVQQVKYELKDTLLFYGGGIENRHQAKEMKEHADVIIVGNSLYTNFKEALRTVEAVQNMK